MLTYGLGYGLGLGLRVSVGLGLGLGLESMSRITIPRTFILQLTLKPSPRDPPKKKETPRTTPPVTKPLVEGKCKVGQNFWNIRISPPWILGFGP